MVRRRRNDALFEQKVLDSIGRGPEAFMLETEMAHIKSPVLLLWCRDDRVIDISASEIFRKGLPNSQTVVLDGCGHMPMMAKPGNVAAALREFVA